MWVGERQTQSESVSQLNAQEVDWTAFLFRKHCDQMSVLEHAGAVCSAPIITSNYPPTRWGATMLGITLTERWLGNGLAEVE
jgi:hypothetical protein